MQPFFLLLQRIIFWFFVIHIIIDVKKSFIEFCIASNVWMQLEKGCIGTEWVNKPCADTSKMLLSIGITITQL